MSARKRSVSVISVSSDSGKLIVKFVNHFDDLIGQFFN